MSEDGEQLPPQMEKRVGLGWGGEKGSCPVTKAEPGLSAFRGVDTAVPGGPGSQLSRLGDRNPDKGPLGSQRPGPRTEAEKASLRRRPSALPGKTGQEADCPAAGAFAPGRRSSLSPAGPVVRG